MNNHANIKNTLPLLRAIISARLQSHLQQTQPAASDPADCLHDGSPFALFMEAHEPTETEYLLLLLALLPHLQPNFFNQLIAEHLPQGGDFPEFGGVKAANHRGILPTGETAQFILAGDDPERRLEVQQLLSSDHWLYQKRILQIEVVREGEPAMSGRLILDPETVELLTVGKVGKPRFSADFPAEYLHTDMEWSDLVLSKQTLTQIREIENWITWNDALMHESGMGRKVKPGYRALFYGPPGTGKTLTASLLGKYTGKDVFRIDLSRVVSKYIGETEKNLSRLFDKAENKNWILFFDEADALFGKRTNVRDAHDKYANQEVAYLLQRVEGFNGLVILATNQRANIDEAFARRFQSMVHFPLPKPDERHELWLKSLPEQFEIGSDIDWRQIAGRYELSGAGILNILHFCSIEALADGSRQIGRDRLESAILREYVKEGKVV